MYYDYYKQDLLKKFINNKSELEKQIYALDWITRNYKKDWQDFENLLKNFKCKDWIKIYKKSYPFNDYIYIYYDLQEISIRNYENDKDFIEKIRNENPDRIVKEYWIKEYVLLNANEILEKIHELLNYKKDRLEKLNKTIKNFDKICDKIEKLLNPLNDFINWQDFQYDFEKLVKDCL